MVWDKILLCACVLLLMEGTSANTYNMEKCDFAGFLDVPEGAPVVVNGGTLTNTVVPNPCSIVFRATNPEHTLTIDLTVMNLIDCSITLNFLFGTEVRTFRCGTPNPGQIYTNMRELTVNFLRGATFSSYKFQFLLTSSKRTLPVVPGDNSNPSEVGLIVGVVAGVFVLLLIVAILAVCCHRRAKKAKILYKANQVKQPIDNNGRQPNSVGFTNSAVQNGYAHESSPRAKTKLLPESEGSSSPSSRPRALNFHSSTKSEASREGQGRGKPGIEYQDDDDTYDKTEDMKRPPKSPFLSALASNSKFKASNASNNRDAEERAKRISSTSSSVGSSGASLDNPPPLPIVPVSKSPTGKRKNHASIRRAYKTASSSEEEFNQMASASAHRDDSGPSSNELASSKDSQKANTKHSLKPDRGKKKGNKKDMKLEDYEPTSGNFQKNTARASKRAQKSPRLGNRGDGFGHRRNRSEGRSDGEESRPGTPTSMYDLESLPPLTRSSSRQSLYASRSSLYRRRGRKGSYAESVASTNYVRDDMEIGRHSRSYSQDYDDDETDGGYERPISRYEKERVFRSMGELGRETKERSTQTLRETATQTGLEQSVIMQPKRVVKRKKRSKSMSAVATQTTKDLKKKEKAETDKEESVEKPKPKPKPKPRKSTASVSTVAAAEESDDGKKKKKKKKRAKSREDLSHADKPELPQDQQLPSQELPGQPYLQNSMHPGAPQMVSVGYPGTAPGVPLQSYGPGYPGGTVIPQTGYMMQPQAGQPVMHQGQPVMHPGQPVMHPGQPVMHQGQPGMHQGQPGMHQGQPVMHQGQPGMHQGQPVMHQGQPVLQTGQPVPPQSAHIPGKPRKSNWDTLCALTDNDLQQKQATMTETGSIASSVFTYNYPSSVGHPGIPVVQPQQSGIVNQAYSNVAYPATVAAVPQTETLPRVPPSYMDAINMDTVSGPPSSGPPSNSYHSGSLSQSGSDTGLPVIHNDTTNLLPKKSSWEVLKEITDNQKNESVV